MHPSSRLRGRTVTPKLHTDNVPHNYGSQSAPSSCSSQGSSSPSPMPKPDNFLFQGGTALAAHYKTSVSCIKMEMEECRMQQMLFYLGEMLMLSTLGYHIAPPNQLQEEGKPTILRKSQMTPEWESLAAALAPLWTADSFYPLRFKRNGGIFMLESDKSVNNAWKDSKAHYQAVYTWKISTHKSPATWALIICLEQSHKHPYICAARFHYSNPVA